MSDDRTVTKRAGFTLIELLVVVAIITLLISILVPSLRRAREAARRALCATIMRQTSLATVLYLEDHAQRFPGWDWSFTPFYGLMLEGRLGPEAAVCPSGKATPEIFPPVVYLGGGAHRSFSANAYLCYRGWEQHGDVPRPAETLFLVEEDEACIDNEHWAVRTDAGGLCWWNMIAARHQPRGANLVFVDGHVDYWVWRDPHTGVYTVQMEPDPDNPDLDRLNRAQCPPFVP